MESLFVSTGVVALAEIGDKTQLLAFILAARFKKPLPIIAGILLATLVNHGLAGALGAWITNSVSREILRGVLGVSFLGMAIWSVTSWRIASRCDWCIPWPPPYSPYWGLRLCLAQGPDSVSDPGS